MYIVSNRQCFLYPCAATQLTYASLSILEGVPCAILQQVGWLGRDTLQHQVEATGVADAQREAQNDHLHFCYGIWALPATAALPVCAPG